MRPVAASRGPRHRLLDLQRRQLLGYRRVCQLIERHALVPDHLPCPSSPTTHTLRRTCRHLLVQPTSRRSPHRRGRGRSAISVGAAAPSAEAPPGGGQIIVEVVRDHQAGEDDQPDQQGMTTTAARSGRAGSAKDQGASPQPGFDRLRISSLMESIP